MSQLPGWLPPLLSLLNRGCAESPMFTATDDEKVFQTGKDVCLTLWPFIRELPEYVAAVRKKTPAHMDAAAKLLSQLADEERVYQQLYLKQCNLAGITNEQLENVASSNGADMLTTAMRRHCFADSYVDGVLAIITAELGATAWARSAQPVFETYFAKRTDDFSAEAVEQGLTWLRLHAKPNLKHAIWLRKMLGDLAQFENNEMPAPVLEVLQAVYAVLQVEKQIPSVLVEQLTVSIG
jgi:pyrroloquinoline quinone (PQQ) biosynthesis protein C